MRPDICLYTYQHESIHAKSIAYLGAVELGGLPEVVQLQKQILGLVAGK
jgi:hypothetical protein